MKTHFHNIPIPERTALRIQAMRELQAVKQLDLKYIPIKDGYAADMLDSEVEVTDKVRFRFHVASDQWITFTVEDEWAEELLRRFKKEKV